MSAMKYGARVDANQGEIVAAARAVGAEVQFLHSVGGGCPDLLVAFHGQWYVVEVKDGAKPPSARKLTPREVTWHEKFNHYAPVHIWETVDDVLRTLGVG